MASARSSASAAMLTMIWGITYLKPLIGGDCAFRVTPPPKKLQIFTAFGRRGCQVYDSIDLGMPHTNLSPAILTNFFFAFSASTTLSSIFSR